MKSRKGLEIAGLRMGEAATDRRGPREDGLTCRR